MNSTVDMVDIFGAINIEKLFGNYIYQKPVFFMQALAAIMAGEMTGSHFALQIEVAPYLHDAKWSIASAYLGGMTHPHYPETYYLLARNIS